jgi:hypothetical protein
MITKGVTSSGGIGLTCPEPEPRSVSPCPLMKGDRVVVKVHAEKRWYGEITGEAKDGHSWWVLKDGTKCPRGIHKTFCRPETVTP